MKKLKILLITDTLELGGAQTHVLTLYNSLKDAGHDVFTVSRGGELSKNINHVPIDLCSHSPITLIRSFFALRSLIKREKFDILHAHARIPALFAHLISKLYSIPLVCTAHARFKVTPLKKRLSFWGDKTIAVSEDLRLYLTKSYEIPPENITVIENGLDTSIFSPASCENPYHVLFLSRLDTDCSLCASLLCELAPRLYACYPELKITIGGGGNDYARILALANATNRAIGKDIVCLAGKIDDVSAFLSSGGVFVGVSRAAIEASACLLPVIISGNEGFLGHLTPQNYEFAKATNFCARTSALPTKELLFNSICSVLDSYSLSLQKAESLRSKILSELDSKALLSRIEYVYLSTIKAHASKKEQNPKTLLFGYYGYSNLGDDALLRASILRAKRDFGDSVGAFSHRKRKSKKDFCIPCFSRKNPFSLVYRISHCERLIFGGGTLLQNATSTRSLIFYIFVLRLAQFLKKDTLLYANGIGKIKQKRLKRLLLSTLQRASYIGLRDRSSYDFLKSELPYSKNLFFESDLALSLPVAPTSRALFLLSYAQKNKSEEKNRTDRFFAVFPRSHALPYERFELENKIKELKLKGLCPLFIVCSPADLRLCYRLYLKFGGAILQNLCFSDLLALLPLTKSALSMRYHPLLAARATATPLIAIGSDPKLEEFN